MQDQDQGQNSTQGAQGIHIVAKPMGPKCNLNCQYCFYLEKQALFPAKSNFQMSAEVLSAYIQKYIEDQPTPVVEFVWQGGEPTLAGLDFYKKVIELQRPYRERKQITNSLQTNGTLLTDEWCQFLKKNNFLVGISLDGPKEIHDLYRKYHGDKGSFDNTLRGLKLLQKHAVDYNVMATVARETAYYPLEVYRFFKEQKVKFIQFTPVVERIADCQSKELGFGLAGPISTDDQEKDIQLTPWSVEAEQYGDFLLAVFDEWVRNDVGKTTVMNFEWALASWMGNTAPVCHHAKKCGRSLMIEHNGDLYACDHSMYPQYRLGNIISDEPMQLAVLSISNGFGEKKDNLPTNCLNCQALNACWGGCPKQRFIKNHPDEPSRHYLCEGYKKFFLSIRKYLHGITRLLENGLPASYIMQAIKGPLVIKVAERN